MMHLLCTSVFLRYNQCVDFFMMKPKPGEDHVAPKEFFGLWTPFCQDFKDTWKREQSRISKERYSKITKIALFLFHSLSE